MKTGLRVLGIAVALLLMLGTYLLAMGPSLPADRLPPLSRYHDPAGAAVDVSFLGNVNLLISDGDTSILIDGFFTRPSTFAIALGSIAPDLDAIDAALKRAGVTELAAVVPVHSHYDHAMDSPEVAARTGAVLLGSESTANIGRGWGLPEGRIVVAEPGRAYRHGRFAVTLLLSRHFVFPDLSLLQDAEIREPVVPPVGALEYREGGAYSVLIEHPESGRWLVQGSAGFSPGALDTVKADVVFLGIGGLGGQTTAYQRDYWRETVLATSPALVVPVHYDAIADRDLGDELALANNLWAQVLGFTPLESIAAVNALADEHGIPVAYPALWDTVTLNVRVP